MPYIITLISLFWLIRTLKMVLFWIYVWQLKDYHIGRFLDHFRTVKGRALLFNKTLLAKVFFLLVLLYSMMVPDNPPYDPWLGPLLLGFFGLFFLYIGEAFKAGRDFLQKKLLKPVFTFKATFLFSVIIVIILTFFLFIFNFSPDILLSLVLFDILTPVIVSVIVLLFQPFFVAARNRILQKAKKKMARFPNLIVVGITGSYGKTSTKEFLATILSAKFKVLSTPEHKNSEIGIAQTILQDLKSDHEIFIVEMGAYNKGGISLLCDIVKPRIGVVTGVNEQHLATFGSLENLLSAEGGRELAENIPSAGLLVLNGDNKYCLDLYKKTDKPKKIYTVNKEKIDSDIWTEELTMKTDSLDFVVVDRDKHATHIVVDVLGAQHVQNLLGAMLVARELDMTFEEIAEAAKKISQAQGGMTLSTGTHGIKVIDSSYSANPDGVRADLDYLKIFGETQPLPRLRRARKVIVMPCLIELGQKSIEVHIQIGKKIAEICDMAVITTRDKFEEIRNGAIINGMSPDNVLFVENQKEIFNLVTTFCSAGDAVLLEGGRPKELIKLLNEK